MKRDHLLRIYICVLWGLRVKQALRWGATCEMERTAYVRHWGHIRWCVMGMIKCLVMFQDGAQAREVAREKAQVRVTLLGSTDLKSSLRARPEFVFVCFKGRSMTLSVRF